MMFCRTLLRMSRSCFAFYDTNCSRNQIFFNTVKSQISPAYAVSRLTEESDHLIDAHRLARFKNVVIMVTGGFHADAAQLFDKEGISNITVSSRNNNRVR